MMYIRTYFFGIFIVTFNVSGKTPNRQAFTSTSFFLHTKEIERVMSMHRFHEEVTIRQVKIHSYIYIFTNYSGSLNTFLQVSL